MRNSCTPGIIRARSAMNTYLLMITFRVWFCEIAVSGFNYFVLMNRVYEPRVGELRAHRIGMTTRIVYIFFPFAYAPLASSSLLPRSDSSEQARSRRGLRGPESS